MVGDAHPTLDIWYQSRHFRPKDCPNRVPMLSMYERKQTLRSVL
jgi:hypothetical protein